MNFSDNSLLFLEEARELLARAEVALLELEVKQNEELVNEVFRALHTIKGSGAMFGFHVVAGFTHSVENLFDEVRKGRLKVDSSIVDLGLKAVDAIGQLLATPEVSETLKELQHEIEGLAGLKERREGEPSRPKGAANPALRLPQVWRIMIRPQPQILTRGVRLEPLFGELAELGVCHVQALFEELPALEKLDPTELHLSWTITLSTEKDLAAIRNVFLFVEDYVDLSIEPVPVLEPAAEPLAPLLGEILVSRGTLNPHQVEEIRQAQRPFGEVAVEEGHVDQTHLEAALAEQNIIRSTNIEREIRQEAATIRVQKEKLDRLIDLVGEMVILQAILDLEAKKETSGAFEPISESLARLVGDLRDTTMSVRMVPLEEMFSLFRRLVRDLSAQVGKELVLNITGGSTELDKNVVEALKDPLVHIIRNTADHGIELPEARQKAGKPVAGTITLGARQVGSRVEITVSDDGDGLNLEKIRAKAIEHKLLDPSETDPARIQAMIFEPGFSTAEKTTGISGRGVGMDVVKRNVERLRGTVAVQSERGRGTTITLSIPLTLVIIEGLLVQIAGSDYVITLSQVVECVDLSPEIQAADGTMILLRETTIPVLSLRDTLGLPGNYGTQPRLVIVNSEGTLVALMVDSVQGRQQVVIKPLSSAIKQIRVLSGATILGDGSVALILDVAELVKIKSAEKDFVSKGV